MSKYPENRIEIMGKAVNAKIISLLLQNFSFEESIKETVKHFNKMYHNDRDSVYNILVSRYHVCEFFAQYISELNGFMDLFKNPENISLIKNLNLKNEVMSTDSVKKEEPKFEINQIDFQNDCFKALKIYTAKGADFNSAVDQTLQAFEKHKREYKGISKEKIISAIAEKCFSIIQGIQKDPMKNILLLVKLLKPEELVHLKANI